MKKEFNEFSSIQILIYRNNRNRSNRNRNRSNRNIGLRWWSQSYSFKWKRQAFCSKSNSRNGIVWFRYRKTYDTRGVVESPTSWTQWKLGWILIPLNYWNLKFNKNISYIIYLHALLFSDRILHTCWELFPSQINWRKNG